MKTYPKIYALLRLAGHSPIYAHRVVIDARRGDPWARTWIWWCFIANRKKVETAP